MGRAGTILLRLGELNLYLGAALLISWLTWQEVEVRWTLERHGQRTEATVVGHERSSGRSGVSFRPILRFRTAEGRWVRATAGGAGTSAVDAVPTGATFAVIYDPAAPARVFAAAELARVGWAIALLPGGGVVLLILALFVFRLRAGLRGPGLRTPGR
ncbi:DUF3592 domain-containing protein [Roseomonas rosulenta]|uniref:DUF3592 domain-containing protein n=1 Tax=Roseomonas rosulenta TaxID=2748667 RepID=UPI0018E05AC6|nr:DUF3592 domain-containing protein [Roseomonas rosulenta]